MTGRPGLQHRPGDALCSLLEFSQVTRRRLLEVQVPALIMQSHRDTIVVPESTEIICAASVHPRTRSASRGSR